MRPFLLALLIASTCKPPLDTGEPIDTLLVDADNDGWFLPDDCDDLNAMVNPEQPEDCAPTDRNCDGDPTLDATDAPVWYTDVDGDGFGRPYGLTETPRVDCFALQGFVLDGTDCNDQDGGVYPGAPDVAGDGRDTDCDGVP